MALRPDLAKRPGYQQLYRELIRSQIHSLVQQLALNGEECFVMSAAVAEPCSHVFGSDKALVYMEDYTGVQKGFLPFIQRGQSGGYSVNTSPTSIVGTTTETSITQQSGSDQNKLISKTEPDNLTTNVKSPLSSQAISDSSDEFSVSNVGSQKVNKKLKRKTFEGMNNEEQDPRRQRSERTPESVTGISNRNQSVTDPGSGPVISSVSGGVMNYESFVQNTLENQSSGNDNKMENKDTVLHRAPKESESNMDIYSNTDNDIANAVSKTENNNSEVTSNEKVLTESVAENDIDANSDNDSAEEFSDLECNDSDFDEMELDEILSGVTIEKMKENEAARTSLDVGNDSEKVDKNTSLNSRLSKRPAETNKIRRAGKQNHGQTQEELRKLREQTKLIKRTVVNHDAEVGIKVTRGHRYVYKNKIISLADLMTEADKTCKYCKKICRTLKECREHEGSHSKKYTCFKCGLDETTQAGLREHNEKCFAVPQFVKDYIRDNPNYTPKRHSTKKSTDRVKQSNSNIEHSVQQSEKLNAVEKLNAPKTPNNKKPLDKDLESASSISGNQTENKMLSDQQKQIFTCSKCKKKFKLRMLLKKHQCIPALSDDRNAGDRVLLGGRVKAASNVTESKTAEENSGYKLKTGHVKMSEITTERSYEYEYLKTLPIVDKTCPVPECGKKLSCVTSVKDHLVTHTKNERPFTCQICKKGFRIKKDLRYHFKKFHMILSKVDSKKSNKVISTKLRSFKSTKLHTKVPKIHVKGKTRILDDKIRNHKCIYCDKKFLSRSHLEEHIVVHTGEKNFQCSTCKLTLLYRYQFKNHKKKCDADHPGQDCVMIRLKARYNLSGNNVVKKKLFKKGVGTEHESGNIREDVANSVDENGVKNKDIFAEEPDKKPNTNDNRIELGTASKSFQNAQSSSTGDGGSHVERKESTVQELMKYSPVSWNSYKVPYICSECKLKFVSGDEYINHTCETICIENKL